MLDVYQTIVYKQMVFTKSVALVGIFSLASLSCILGLCKSNQGFTRLQKQFKKQAEVAQIRYTAASTSKINTGNYARTLGSTLYRTRPSLG